MSSVRTPDAEDRRAEAPAVLLYARGDVVSYVDRHRRNQTGEVRTIEARWDYGPVGRRPLIVYTLRHPTYAGNRFYTTSDAIIGLARPTPDRRDPGREDDHG